MNATEISTLIVAIVGVLGALASWLNAQAAHARLNAHLLANTDSKKQASQ